MGENFEIWLKKELELANKNSQSPEMWTRKNAQDRLDHLKFALMMLMEFRASTKDQHPPNG